MRHNSFATWKEVIVSFFEYNVQNIKSGQSCRLFKAREYISKKEADIRKESDTNQLTKLKTAREKKVKELYDLRKKAPSTEIRDWINTASSRQVGQGKRIIKATHVLKFSHSSSENAGILLTKKSEDKLLTTSSLKKELAIDLAHNNGNLITISRFLNLKFSGKRIFDLIQGGDFSFLKPFYEKKEQYEVWKNGFSNLIEQREIKTADKTKQVYFPIAVIDTYSPQDYHLLTPLLSSSMTEEMSMIINEFKYGEKQKKIKESTNSETPHFMDSDYIVYPELGVLNFGGEHAKNVSMLNADRGGKLYLFSAQPPKWQSQVKPPINMKSWFDRGIPLAAVKEDIDYLRDYLLRFDRLELSTRNPERSKWLEKWGSRIADVVLFNAGIIQNLPAGWSNDPKIKLKFEHQYFLDPFRPDEVFQTERKASNWQRFICEDFAAWLNWKLMGRDKKFTPQSEHTMLWAQLMETPLRELSQTMDASLTPNKKEIVNKKEGA